MSGTTTVYGWTYPVLGDAADITEIQTLAAAQDTTIAAIDSSGAVKPWVRAINTANVSVSSLPSTMDGVSMATGDLFWNTGQSTASQNGPWVYSTAGSAATRPAWFAAATGTAPVKPGHLVVGGMEGTANGGVWQNANTGTITVGTTALTYVKQSGIAQQVQAFTTSGTITTYGGRLVTYNGAASQTLTLPAATPGLKYEVWNTGSNSVSVSRSGSDTVTDSINTSSGVGLGAGIGVTLVCVTSGQWIYSALTPELVHKNMLFTENLVGPGSSAATIILGNNGGVISGANDATIAPALIRIVNADLTSLQSAVGIKLRATVTCNNIAPGSVSWAFDLYPITIGGTAGNITFTVGSGVWGPAATPTPTQAASNTVDSDIAGAPSDGLYAIGVVQTNATAANSVSILSAVLQSVRK